MVKSILLLTAHPDDECMFFTPTIRQFIGKGYEIDLICFSTGDFDGNGQVRCKELESSAKVLGISSIHIINDPNLQDGPGNIWNPKDILKHLNSFTRLKRYERIITFDDAGVSGHLNHCSLSKALKVGGIEAWRLKSLPVWMKYSGALGSFILSIFKSKSSSNIVTCRISLKESYQFGYNAMIKHESQMVWFRKLYLLFSIYMTLNYLTK